MAVIDSDLALRTSEAMFAEASTAVIAAEGDSGALGIAAQAAIALGAPLLTTGGRIATSVGGSTPPVTSAPDAIARELARLGTTSILVIGTVGELDVGDAVRHDIDATPQALAGQLGGEPDAIGAPADVPDIAAYAVPDDPGHGTGDLGRLPEHAPAADVTAVVENTPDAFAAAATVKAAGGRIVPQSRPGDILADGEIITALSSGPAQPTLLIGHGFTTQPDPDWSVRAARAGTQLPGGGQRLFGDHRFVAVYGTPGTPVLGVLGEQSAEDTVARAAALAAEYAPLSDVPVVPTLEIIATVAAGSAGDDGDYSNELDPGGLVEFVDAAAAAGAYVVLDLQPGRTDFLTQAKRYASLLERPGVGLALDPEWRLGPDQVPLEQIGSVGASEINAVAAWLADLVDEKSLPPKMFVLHEFRASMIGDREALVTDIPQLEFLVHVDGQGAQPDKQATYAAMLAIPPVGVAAGWKNFIDEDAPMLTPQQTMSGVSPVPDFISYQ